MDETSGNETDARTAVARRRLRKFLDRSAPGLGQPIIDLRDPDSGEIALTLTWERSSPHAPWRPSALSRPMLDKRTLDSVIVECRVFFLAQEDCYLPGVVKALQTLVTSEQARARRSLVAHVRQVIRDGQLVMPERGAPMYSGRLEADNGLGPGRLLGTDQITMDYINGVALHEDEERRARIANISNEESIRFAVILQLDALLRIVANVRDQVEHDLRSGYFTLT